MANENQYTADDLWDMTRGNTNCDGLAKTSSQSSVSIEPYVKVSAKEGLLRRVSKFKDVLDKVGIEVGIKGTF